MTATSSSSSSGMLLHRKNDSRDASSRSLSRYGRAGRHGSAAPLRRDTGTRGDEDARQRLLDARFEVPVLAALLIEPHQRLDFVVEQRPAIRAAGQRRDDLSRAGRFFARG